MEIPDKIRKLSREQLDLIIASRRSVPLVDWLHINAKARTACSVRHPGWMEESNKYSNATIQASIRVGLQNAVSLGTLISAFESMALAVIAKLDLTLEEYDLLLSPVISAFPELIVLEQDWTPEPIDESSRYRPRVAYQTPPIDLKPDKTKKHRPYRRTEDLETAVEEAAFDPTDLMAALKPKEVKPQVSKEEALQKMLDSMKPKLPITKSIDPQPLISEEQAPFTENILTSDKPKFLKLTTIEGGFRLEDKETGEFFGEKFTAPIEAIIWAAKNGMKIK